MSNTEAEPSASSSNCTFFKKSGNRNRNRGNVRKREENNSGSDDDDSSAVVKFERKSDGFNPMRQKSGIKKKRGDSGKDTDDNAADDLSVTYKSTKSGKTEGPQDMGATATVEIETQLDRDAQAVFERSKEINEEMKGKAEDNLYRGQAGYTSYIDKKDTALANASSGLVRKGPVRAPANLRRTIRWDYEPCICKDWNETGFCGFGDSCKFLHDRTDYKHGWQLDREVEEGRYDKDKDVNYEISDEEDELPFACFICREAFKCPVVTKCKHYFCEKCALGHYKKSKRCFVCGTQTFGVFNTAKEIIRKMKKQAEEKEEEKEEEEGEGCGEDVNVEVADVD